MEKQDALASKQRESNLELLRIIAMCGVIILHYNNPLIGKAFELVKDNTLNYWIIHFLESLFICSVNLFMVISGYFMVTSKKKKFMEGNRTYNTSHYN